MLFLQRVDYNFKERLHKIGIQTDSCCVFTGLIKQYRWENYFLCVCIPVLTCTSVQVNTNASYWSRSNILYIDHIINFISKYVYIWFILPLNKEGASIVSRNFSHLWTNSSRSNPPQGISALVIISKYHSFFQIKISKMLFCPMYPPYHKTPLFRTNLSWKQI